jgi:MarR family transcriptional regulator for hemolysin
VHVVALTAAGEDAFVRLRGAAIVFDRQIRRGISDEESAIFGDLLGRLAANAGADDGAAPWAGFAEHTP